ncbi:hypothetical protein RHSIM_Rhsim08G0115200 [Rhododendron simsii]|uniref:No apical meristem-associated C-terminal domain-containing protein n=1 Tax=Rhododendron simsii TaxID=118357 RepID=A0A834LH02_RHOSS|nr:hypothetical protein RHSIM_Rhsim08G0115200 [Rhododendron simsii]
MELAGKSSQRGRAFLVEEDKILCCAWLEVSQDPVKGANQRKEKLWEHIACLYKERKPNYNSGARTTKSLQCRMALINKAINKFRGCVRSVEHQHPSGASEIDILEKSKILFAQDMDEKKGFQFDHVWPILKEAEKWLEVPNEQNFDCAEGSPSLASLGTPAFVDLNANGDFQAEGYHVDSSSRPMGTKKAKMMKTDIAHKNAVIDSLVEGNREILENLKRGREQREERLAKIKNEAVANRELTMLHAENERNKLQLERERQEKEFMERDLNSIEDPTDREYFRRKKLEILLKNGQVTDSSTFNYGDFNTYSQYHSDGGLPDY